MTAAPEEAVRSDVRRATRVEGHLEAAICSIESALDADEDLLRMLGLDERLRRLRADLGYEVRSAIYRVRTYLAALGANRERPTAAHPTPEPDHDTVHPTPEWAASHEPAARVIDAATGRELGDPR